MKTKEDSTLLIRRPTLVQPTAVKLTYIIAEEFVLRYATANSSNTSESQGGKGDDNAVPAPLLSNFGAASSGDYVEDLKMMILTSARERTLDEFVGIG